MSVICLNLNPNQMLSCPTIPNPFAPYLRHQDPLAVCPALHRGARVQVWCPGHPQGLQLLPKEAAQGVDQVLPHQGRAGEHLVEPQPGGGSGGQGVPATV